jgi:hypothetical protein
MEYTITRRCTECGEEKSLEMFYFRKNGYLSDSRCRICISLSRKQYYQENSELIMKNTATYRRENPEAVRYMYIRYSKNNPDKRNAQSSKRRAYKKDAIPGWVNLKEIEKYFSLAKIKELETGIPHAVDHIVPLKGRSRDGVEVCGLHWEGNLQVIPALENTSKGNRYWPDMPEPI